MFYLGIDIAKNTHVASLMDEKGKTLFKGFSFSNTTEGGKSLLEMIKKYSEFSDVTVGMEATGHYWLSIYSFLYDYDFYCIHVINPIQTDGWRKGTEIRKRKNDTIDSVLIADLIRYGDFVETTLSNEDLYSLRNICRMRNYNDIEGVYNIINVFFSIITKGLTIVCIGIYIVMQSKEMALVLGGLAAGCFLIIQLIYGK